MRTINLLWKARIEREIPICEQKPIDETTSFNLAIQWLICRLTRDNIPFKLYNLGAGVKRLTTKTDTCPCCKKPL